MSPAKVIAISAGALSLATLCTLPTMAETITLTCTADAALNTPEMTIVYEGKDEGSLTVAGPFGAMALPATRESREGTDENGQPLSATGIRAAGPAMVVMPDKAALEACVADKLPPDQLADPDMVFLTLMGCEAEVALTGQPVEISASVEIATSPIVYVGVTRTFAETTELAGGTISLESYPSCSIAP